jgi:DNA-binding MarR family transcriptional regulator
MAALGAAWQVGKPVPVTDAARVLPGVSERTVFRRMKSLRAKGLLQFVGDEQDARIRHVKPTERAEAYFDGLGRCIEQARGKA